MDIVKKQDGESVTIALKGRLDTLTSPDLEKELRVTLPGVREMIFDLTDLAYVSSAGLRVLLSAQKAMNKQGYMVIRGVKPEIMDIFEVTGFVDILNIEE